MKLKRFVAYLIDILLVGFIASSIASIDVLNPYYDDYLDAYDKFNETSVFKLKKLVLGNSTVVFSKL